MSWCGDEKINKYKSQCFDRAKCKYCAYWHAKLAMDSQAVIGYRCVLFNVDKDTHTSLHECDRKYGVTYDGLP